ncbi:response regulator transcription factor [Paenibacillus qinlingensis]|uniref:response regulator transcription factor n=1 Tax=Paenibacillus qinlingensis TaxID=1837343 RepID=UPI0015643C0E|nr:helix-turn-helix domain-containing protein [Paenibacillus qinlingensis]NQX63315.1 helix-turn-helix domain-containing protein [Paenibacillus qinlingensis]
MYNLLVVDDEMYTVKGITQSINWGAFDAVFEAYDVETAIEILTQHPIHIMISDIDMPGKSGLELLEWVKEYSPMTQTIFLSGHANFQFAQQAVHLGSFEYLLKPVENEQLEQVVANALGVVRESNEQKQYGKVLEKYYKEWFVQLPLMVERFWQDVLNERISLVSERTAVALDLYQIPLSVTDSITPIVINIEHWKEEMSVRDEEIMGYAVRNVAAEIILNNRSGHVIQDSSGGHVVLLYDNGLERLSHDELQRRCQLYLDMCFQYFECSMSCYVGDSVELNGLVSEYRDLLKLERNNIMTVGCVVFKFEHMRRDVVTVIPLLDFGEWSLLFETGRKTELYTKLDQVVERWKHEVIPPESLEAFYHGYIHMIYNTVHSLGYSIHNIYSLRDLSSESQAIRSMVHFSLWAKRIAAIGMDYFNQESDSDNGGVIASVKQYMEINISLEFTREDIAQYVHLNPAYLSRLFKKETGLSLADYILQIRIDKAKRLLEETSLKISTVAEAVGYSHFSHFGKMFKKLTSFTPQDYRKMVKSSDDAD